MSVTALSRARLARMHDIMASHVERGSVPGLVTLVSHRGEIHVDTIGTQTRDRNIPVQRDTIFRISSMTKPITAVATMILVEECRVRLDEPVDRWLPELAERKVLRRENGPLEDTVPANRSITVRDLLTFRMGFGQMMASPEDYPILKEAIAQEIGMGPPSPSTLPAPDEWLRRLGQLPLMHQPGEKWMYNTGSDVLGMLIARVSGQPLETFLRERVFEPLGMKDTGFSVPPSEIDRLATSYWTDPASGELTVYDEAANGQWSRPPAFPSGAGGLVSTIDDYLAFAQMMLAYGKHEGTRILSRPTIETMITDQLTPEQKAKSGLVSGYFDNHGWGFGVSIVTRRYDVAAAPGRYGWDGGLGTSWYSDPKEDMITILMTQRAWTSPQPPEVCLDFWTSAYQAIDD
ncbi:serine hydrolase [Ktedonobacter sp. SOSP1-85]|uniref:serine hydrolase domain-containing protein n=1 Tax=Ktedonobacter sp. SOSP1-85 TaxID=2778367 RepID=UPI001915A8EC|nr:serine hydrolase domain-containing protein [Ktedonobacter sp. SOSP1-85]GHO77542.1 serine hydrolase [Ktedonobacter sp. SOSP1-85]